MATFSQFNKKYITERRSKNIGDEGTKNIVKKLLGKYSIPDDGGKSGQSKIEKELKLNNTKKTSKLNKEISNRKLDQLKKQELFKKQIGTYDDLSDGGNTSNTNIKKKYTPPSKTQSQNIQTNSVKNTAKKIADQGKTVNKIINPNAPKGVGAPSVNKGAGTGSKANVDLPKFTQTNSPSFKTSKVTTGNTINYVEKPRVEIKNPPGMVDKRSYKGPAKNLDVDLPTRKPRTIVKSYTTQPKSPVDVKGTLTRGLERTGLKSIEPKQKVGDKIKNIPQSKITKNIIKKTPKKLVFNRALSGLGRVAGGAFAVKDFMDTARKEKALGRGKTAARLRGASKAIGGYVGGGIGALAGGLAGGGVASAALGIGGGIAGYQAGSKIGDQIYKTGRKLVTGKKTFKDLRKDINKGIKSAPKKIDKLLSPT